MTKHGFITAATALGVVVAAMPAQLGAVSRDADGSRMQAREMALGAADSDALSPPSDAVDWRYLRLSEAHRLVVEVNGAPASVPVTVQLTSAVGDRIAQASSSKGRATLSTQLDPGLYYVSVSASADLRYTMSLR